MRRRLEIVESVTEVKGKAVFGATKTHATRSVPVRPTLAGRGREELVFRAPRGGVLLLRNWRRQVFDPAVRAAGSRRAHTPRAQAYGGKPASRAS